MLEEKDEEEMKDSTIFFMFIKFYFRFAREIIIFPTPRYCSVFVQKHHCTFFIIIMKMNGIKLTAFACPLFAH
jgi:hypothetical protein